MKITRVRSFKNFDHHDRERGGEKGSTHRRKTACRVQESNVQEYVHIVPEKGENLSPRGSRNWEEHKRRGARKIWSLRVLRMHIPRSIYVNEYIHRTVSLFDYFSKPASEALIYIYLIRANVKTLNRYASRKRSSVAPFRAVAFT